MTEDISSAIFPIQNKLKKSNACSLQEWSKNDDVNNFTACIIWNFAHGYEQGRVGHGSVISFFFYLIHFDMWIVCVFRIQYQYYENILTFILTKLYLFGKRNFRNLFGIWPPFNLSWKKGNTKSFSQYYFVLGINSGVSKIECQVIYNDISKEHDTFNEKQKYLTSGLFFLTVFSFFRWLSRLFGANRRQGLEDLFGGGLLGGGLGIFGVIGKIERCLSMGTCWQYVHLYEILLVKCASLRAFSSKMCLFKGTCSTNFENIYQWRSTFQSRSVPRPAHVTRFMRTRMTRPNTLPRPYLV